MTKNKEDVVLTYEADSEFMENFQDEIVMKMFNDPEKFQDFWVMEKLKADISSLKEYLRVYPMFRKDKEFSDLKEWLDNRLVMAKRGW